MDLALLKELDIVPTDMPDVLGTMERWLIGEPVWTYEEVLERWGRDFEMYRRAWMRPGVDAVKRSTAMLALRDVYVRKYGFALPCAELLHELAKADHVVEIGAGSGYMTRLMRNHGINVTGSDLQTGRYGFTLAAYDDQQVIAAGKTMVRRHRDATIFCSWPSYQETWFRQALRAMRIGQRIVMVMEDACADETARNYLDACFEQEHTIDIPAFTYLNDLVSVAVKKRERPRAHWDKLLTRALV